MHGAGSPRAQRVQIARLAKLEEKEGLAKKLAGVAENDESGGKPQPFDPEVTLIVSHDGLSASNPTVPGLCAGSDEVRFARSWKWSILGFGPSLRC
jgi:hypothetical protein